MSYQLCKPAPEMGSRICHVLRDDGAMVPVDSKNADFQEFLVWNGRQTPPLPWHLPWVDPDPDPE